MTAQLTQAGEPLPWQAKTTLPQLYIAGGNNGDHKQSNEKSFPLNNMQWLALRAYEEMMRLKNYSRNTIQNYRCSFIHFLNYWGERKPSTLNKYEIMDYLLKMKNEENWTWNRQNQIDPVG